jgi:carboxypeptidase C (cathepsin A)
MKLPETVTKLTNASSAYTGYIDLEARHLFLHFFESRRDPDKDPVVLWTNGGPGGSLATGSFMEFGPRILLGPDNTTFSRALGMSTLMFSL